MTSSRGSDARAPRVGRTASGVVAFLLLVAIVVAVPVGLLLAGAIPHGAFLVRDARHLHWPPWGLQPGTSPIGSDASPEAFAGACAGLIATSAAWATWFWTIMCLAVDILARRRGVQAARLPASRTLQALSACLVGASLALIANGRLSGSSSVRSQAPYVQQAVLGDRLASVMRVVEDPRDVLLGGQPCATVTPGTSPFATPGEPEGAGTPIDAGEPSWSLEEIDQRSPSRMNGLQLSGDCNAARTAVRDEGVSRLDESGDVSAAIGGPGRAVARTASIGHRVHRASTHVVGGRETLWSIAEEELGSPRRWRELAECNYGRVQGDGGKLERDHFLRPGWVLLLPQAGADRPPGASRSEPSSLRPEAPDEVEAMSPDARVPEVRTAEEAGRPRRDGHSPSQSPSPARNVPGVDHLDLLGIGFIGTIDRLRRAQQRHRPPHSSPQVLDPSWYGVERRFRSGMDPWFVPDIEHALGQMNAAFGGQGMPDISSILVTDEAIDVAFVGVSDPAELEVALGDRGAGRAAEGSDGRLSMQREPRSGRSDPPVRVHPVRIPCPALVTGRVEGTESGIRLINVEVGGPFRLEGSRAERSESLAFVALELCMSPWGRQIDVSLIGNGGTFPPALPVDVASDPEELIRAAHMRRLGRRRLMDEHGWRSVADARTASTDPVWNTSVVLCGTELPAQVEAELCELALDQLAGLAVVTVGAGVENRQLQLALPQAELSLPVRGHGVLEAIDGLIEGAADHSCGGADVEYQGIGIGRPRQAARIGRQARPRIGRDAPVHGVRVGALRPVDLDAAPVEIRVLGPVEIVGSARPFSRAWARELIVYLAMHPNGASNDLWSTALWPDRLLAASSLHSTASVARRALGTDRDGLDHLPRAHGRLQLGPHVSTDWARLDELADRDDPESWRAALELVRGRPFEGLKATDWLVLEGIGPAVEARVVDVATGYAEWCLEAGDPSDAEWSARRGLLASPYDERLYRVLLRAADAAGNPAGVEAVMAELIRLVAEDVEPFDSVHPETLDLYRSLSRRRTLVSR